jgi:hypothetical protein
MSNPYTVKIGSIVDDGTNIFVDLSICDGQHTFPTVTPFFAHGTTAATIQAYAQVIANNQPTLDGSLGALVNTVIKGA